MSNLSEAQKALMEKLKLRFDNLRNLGIFSVIYYYAFVAFSKVSLDGTTDDYIKLFISLALFLFTALVGYWYVGHTLLMLAEESIRRHFKLFFTSVLWFFFAIHITVISVLAKS